MARQGRSWWGKRFIEALEGCMDAGRLSRGRSYNSPYRIEEFEITEKGAVARVRGNKNPYFGVYKTPHYAVRIEFKRLSKAAWKKALDNMAKSPARLFKLFMHEMPDDIEECFEGKRTSLLPRSGSDIMGQCSCPDWANPCKHIAGVYFRLADILDHDPLLLFEWRGMDFEHLVKALKKYPLAKAISTAIISEREAKNEIEAEKTVFNQVDIKGRVRNGKKMETGLEGFWMGRIGERRHFSAECLELRRSFFRPPVLNALHLKKEGDHPAFWNKRQSFLKVMEDVYERISKDS